MSSSNDDSPGNYDSETQTYRLHYDWDSEEHLSTVIIDAVAAVTNTEPLDIGPLNDVVDPDALDRLFAPTTTQTRCHAASYLCFSIHGCEITVSGDGQIKIQLPNS